MLVRVWGDEIRARGPRFLPQTNVAIWWVVIHRRKSGLKVHVSGLQSTVEGQGPLAFISHTMLVKAHAKR